MPNPALLNPVLLNPVLPTSERALIGQAFVLERRVNRPLMQVDAAFWGGRLPGVVVGEGETPALCFDAPFRRAAGAGCPAWRTTARLLTGRRRLGAGIEVEVGEWSADATHLLVRPLHRHPERWGAHRQQRYFTLAHLAADQTARALARPRVLEPAGRGERMLVRAR